MSKRSKAYISRDTIDLPNKAVRLRKRLTKKQMAEYKRHRSQCGTATTSRSSAGIKGRRQPKGVIAQSIAPPPIEAVIAAMTPKNLPEPHRYRIG